MRSSAYRWRRFFMADSIILSIDFDRSMHARRMAIHKMNGDEHLHEQIFLHDILTWCYRYTPIRIPLDTDFYCGFNYVFYSPRIIWWHGRLEPLREIHIEKSHQYLWEIQIFLCRANISNKKKANDVQKKIKFFEKNMPSKKGNEEAGNLYRLKWPRWFMVKQACRYM